MKLEFSRQILENTPFHENPSIGAELLHVDRRTDGRTDRHDEADSLFPQFCKLA